MLSASPEPEEEELVAHLEEDSMLTKLEVTASLEVAEAESNGKSDDEYSTASEGDNSRAYEEEGGEGHMVSNSPSLNVRSLDMHARFGELLPSPVVKWFVPYLYYCYHGYKVSPSCLRFMRSLKSLFTHSKFALLT